MDANIFMCVKGQISSPIRTNWKQRTIGMAGGGGLPT